MVTDKMLETGISMVLALVNIFCEAIVIAISVNRK